MYFIIRETGSQQRKFYSRYLFINILLFIVLFIAHYIKSITKGSFEFNIDNKSRQNIFKCLF